jgi:hypothetical protein
MFIYYWYKSVCIYSCLFKDASSESAPNCIASTDRMIKAQWISNWKMEVMRRGAMWDISRHFHGRIEENHEYLVTTTSLGAVIWSQDLPNVKHCTAICGTNCVGSLILWDVYTLWCHMSQSYKLFFAYSVCVFTILKNISSREVIVMRYRIRPYYIYVLTFCKMSWFSTFSKVRFGLRV